MLLEGERAREMKANKGGQLNGQNAGQHETHKEGSKQSLIRSEQQ